MAKNRIREVREARGMTLQQVARAAGMSHQMLLRLEKGERTLSDKWLSRLAPVLGVRKADLLLDDSDGNFFKWEEQAVSVPTVTKKRDLPLFGQPLIGEADYFQMTKQARALIERPAVLEDVEGAYAVPMYGSSMEPKYDEGQTLYCNPVPPPRPGNYVNVILRTGRATIGRLVSRTAKEIVIERLNPKSRTSIPIRDVEAIHKIVHADEV